MVRKLSLILLILAGIVVAGCDSGGGPNDPVVSGQDINKIQNERLPEEDKKMFDELSSGAAIPGEGGKK